jgi:hypothetical protein
MACSGGSRHISTKLEPVLGERLAGLLREYPEIEVVVTSSWTDAYSLKYIKDLFPPDIASRIVGKTAFNGSAACVQSGPAVGRPRRNSSSM